MGFVLDKTTDTRTYLAEQVAVRATSAPSTIFPQIFCRNEHTGCEWLSTTKRSESKRNQFLHWISNFCIPPRRSTVLASNVFIYPNVGPAAHFKLRSFCARSPRMDFTGTHSTFVSPPFSSPRQLFALVGFDLIFYEACKNSPKEVTGLIRERKTVVHVFEGVWSAEVVSVKGAEEHFGEEGSCRF